MTAPIIKTGEGWMLHPLCYEARKAASFKFYATRRAANLARAYWAARGVRFDVCHANELIDANGLSSYGYFHEHSEGVSVFSVTCSSGRKAGV
jgi:hypothetical protein